MKLRYYLRGLAVGLLTATVILTIVNADNRPLTDAEIRVRALELGMVDGESVRLSDLQGGSRTSARAPSQDKTAGNDTSGADGAQGAASGTDRPAGGGSSSGEPDEGRTGSQGASGASGTDGAQGAASRSSETESPAGEGGELPGAGEASESVTIQIKGGDSSYTVSKALAAAGLVEDAAEYDSYLCNNGYSKTIRAGTYVILPGTSGEEIAKMIAQ